MRVGQNSIGVDIPPVLEYLIGGVLGTWIVVFYGWMIVECIRGVRTRRRAAWLIFMFVLPISSAVIYFVFTRSQESDSAAKT